MKAISPELIAIIGAAIMLAAAILPGQYAMRHDIAEMHRDVGDLRERMAKFEGTVDVLSKFLIDREQHGGREAAK